MFRNIEAIYRMNRSFLKSLKEIGPSPSSPRALGDLLMRWIDDLEVPYARYCENYFIGFDNWSSVQKNTKLPELLAEISSSTNADGTPVVFSDRKRSPSEIWTLDCLFALPELRLKYYKKLYSRLLKSTHPGRSDHKLLVGANDKLDELLDKSAKKISMGILDRSPVTAKFNVETVRPAEPTLKPKPAPSSSSSASYAPVGSASMQPVTSLAAKLGKLDFSNTSLGNLDVPATPGGAEVPLSPLIIGQQARPPPLMTTTPSESSPSTRSETVSPVTPGGLYPADDLERSLAVERVLDIFTMKPKKCQLRINPPTLPFKRELRRSADVVIDFVPLSTGQETTWRRAHIYLLTDLFLVCDRMTPDEKNERSMGPEAMWLLFPPLAGKHLNVVDAAGPGNALLITILKKETLKVHMPSRREKEAWLAAFEDCYTFASNLAPKGPAGAPSGPSPLGGAPKQAGPALIKGLGLSSSDIGSPGPGALVPGSWPNLQGTPQQQDSRLAAPSTPVFGRAGSTHSASPPHSAGSFEGANGRPSADGLSSPNMSGLSRVASPVSMSDASSSSAPNGGGNSIFGRPFLGGPPTRPGPMGPPQPPSSSSSGRSANGGPFPPAPIPKGSPHLGGLNINGGMMRPPLPPAGKPHGLFDGNVGPPRSIPSPMGSRSDTPLSMASGRASPFPAPHGPRGGAQGGAGSPPKAHGMPGQLSAPQHREPSRHPSAPNLRDQAKNATNAPVARTRSASSGKSGGGYKLPSEMMRDGDLKGTPDYSPPSSPVLKPTGPVTSTVSAQMRCRLYIKQSHAQWKSLGNARLKLYHLLPADERQLVVENDRKTLVSTIILPDGVERVGKVGVAVEISDAGKHTGIIYMLQMRSEESAQGLFGELIDGSGRTIAV